jgi:hypothetical protein
MKKKGCTIYFKNEDIERLDNLEKRAKYFKRNQIILFAIEFLNEKIENKDKNLEMLFDFNLQETKIEDKKPHIQKHFCKRCQENTNFRKADNSENWFCLACGIELDPQIFCFECNKQTEHKYNDPDWTCSICNSVNSRYID